MIITDKQSLIKTLRENKEQFVQLGVARIGIFGSFVRDEATNESDVDVIVEFEPGKKKFRSFMNLYRALETLTERHVDVATKESLVDHRAPAILKEVEYVF